MEFNNNNYFREGLKSCLLFCVCAALFLAIPADAFASTQQDAISAVVCAVVVKLQGPIGQAIATIAVVVLGVTLFLGKVQWATAVTTAVGIGLIFGAASILTWISENSGSEVTASAGC